MAQDRAVVDHLVRGRQALETEVDELNTTIEQLTETISQLVATIEQRSTAIAALDGVIGLVDAGFDPPAVPSVRSYSLARSQTVSAPSSAPAARTPRKATAAKAAPARSRRSSGEAPKSIRVHVLEMLAAENREWGLSEIIDRVHEAGIQAHDDAVRSITIKLMKDGRVERVGRGQYRLAQRGSRGNTSSTPAATYVPEATVTIEAEPVAEAATSFSIPDAASAPIDGQSGDTGAATTSADTTSAHPTSADTTSADYGVGDDSSHDDEVGLDIIGGSDDESTSAESEQGIGSSSSSYTPPLNLGQPWS